MSETNYVLVSPLLQIDDPDVEMLEFDVRFDPFFFAGQDLGLFYPNEEIEQYLYFIIEECNQRWGTDWQGFLVQDSMVAYGTQMPGQPDGCDEKVVYMKEAQQ
jgi:hypothetical protein